MTCSTKRASISGTKRQSPEEEKGREGGGKGGKETIRIF